jgi:hypothetical protein
MYVWISKWSPRAAIGDACSRSSHKSILTHSTEHDPVSVSVDNHITVASKDRSTGRKSSAHPVGVLVGDDGGLGSQAQRGVRLIAGSRPPIVGFKRIGLGFVSLCTRRSALGPGNERASSAFSHSSSGVLPPGDRRSPNAEGMSTDKDKNAGPPRGNPGYVTLTPHSRFAQESGHVDGTEGSPAQSRGDGVTACDCCRPQSWQAEGRREHRCSFASSFPAATAVPEHYRRGRVNPPGAGPTTGAICII